MLPSTRSAKKHRKTSSSKNISETYVPMHRGQTCLQLCINIFDAQYWKKDCEFDASDNDYDKNTTPSQRSYVPVAPTTFSMNCFCLEANSFISLSCRCFALCRLDNQSQCTVRHAPSQKPGKLEINQNNTEPVLNLLYHIKLSVPFIRYFLSVAVCRPVWGLQHHALRLSVLVLVFKFWSCAHECQQALQMLLQLAQWLERWTCDQQVVGSNPTWRKSCITTFGKLFTPVCLCHQAV